WYGHDGSDYEIFFYDGTTTTQITDNSYEDQGPQVSGSNVVWRGAEEIFFYDGITTTQLTHDGPIHGSYPQIFGSTIVWDNGLGGEIFIAEKCEHTLTGDLNGDCKVDFLDFAIFASAWLTEDGDPGWNPDCDISVPADDVINWSDLLVFVENWLIDCFAEPDNPACVPK
ncbi:MAG: hypothetical protein KAS96_00850, partial [Planctomycetes bacterium]|nr:hypothetical protein [Planctomycetota bacterium]